MDWNKNVGTEEHRVSLLHEYAVGVIWDMLKTRNDGREERGDRTKGGRRKKDEKVQLPQLDGSLSGDVLDGVEHITVPDGLDAVRGYVPDLALRDADLKVIRVIEVVVTHPTPAPKLRHLTEGGIEVIQVPIRSEQDIYDLRPSHSYRSEEIQWRPFYMRTDGPGAGVNFQSLSKPQSQADEAIDELIKNLVLCTPAQRRKLLAVLKAMNSTEALLTLRPDNPKRSVVYPGDARVDEGE